MPPVWTRSRTCWRCIGAGPGPYPHRLESALKGTPQTRYSILFAFPGNSLSLTAARSAGDFLETLDTWWRREHIDAPGESPAELPFRGG